MGPPQAPAHPGGGLFLSPDLSAGVAALSLGQPAGPAAPGKPPPVHGRVGAGKTLANQLPSDVPFPAPPPSAIPVLAPPPGGLAASPAAVHTAAAPAAQLPVSPPQAAVAAAPVALSTSPAINPLDQPVPLLQPAAPAPASPPPAEPAPATTGKAFENDALSITLDAARHPTEPTSVLYTATIVNKLTTPITDLVLMLAVPKVRPGQPRPVAQGGTPR